MLQAFIIVAREGLESFLIVAIILAYLRKTGRPQLRPVVYAGIAASLLLSAAMGYALMSVANQALWEGVLATIAVFMVGSLVVHMWKVGPQLKSQMENQLAQISLRPSSKAAIAGVFLFTALMITREGMETALMLFQVKNQNFVLGAFLGMVAAIAIAWLWTKFSHLVNIGRFFRVTGVFLLIFMAQTAMYAFHELCEAHIFPNSDYWHGVTEPYGPDGVYGQWFSFISVAAIGVWLIAAGISDKVKRSKRQVSEKNMSRLESLKEPAKTTV